MFKELKKNNQINRSISDKSLSNTSIKSWQIGENKKFILIFFTRVSGIFMLQPLSTL